jgi:hypothetical protein
LASDPLRVPYGWHFLSHVRADHQRLEALLHNQASD